MEVTYIDYLNQFNLWLESNALPASSQLMYFKLLNIFNRAGWPETVQVDNRKMELLLDVQSEATVIRARERLVSAGFISYKKGKKGTPNQYSLVDIYSNDCSISASESASISDSISASESASHIKTKNKTKNKKYTSCSEQAPLASAPENPPVVVLPLNDGTEYSVSQEQCQKWTGLYPAVDVIQQLRNMKGWLEANPRRRKTKAGISRFVNSWLAKDQNRGGTPGYTGQEGPGPEPYLHFPLLPEEDDSVLVGENVRLEDLHW